MKSLFVKSSKTFKYGFVLDEQEIRRMAGLIQEQIKKAGFDQPQLKYYITFKNGTFAEVDNLDYVVGQENSGSSEISYLGLASQNLPFSVNPETDFNSELLSIKVEFENIDITDSSNRPIRYSIRGTDKDWVMVSSSLIQERIEKNKRKTWTIRNSVFFPIFNSWIFLLLLSIIFNFADEISTKLYFQDYKPILTKEDSIKAISNREKAIAKDTVLNYFKSVEKDTAGAYSKDFKNYVRLQKLLFNKQYSYDYELRKFTKYEWKAERSYLSQIIGNKLLFISIILMILTLIFYIANAKNFWGLYPAFNFLIGENVKIFESKERKRKILLGVIGVTILLGLIVNLTSNYLWHLLN